jgi:hypothetical protein
MQMTLILTGLRGGPRSEVRVVIGDGCLQRPDLTPNDQVY